MSASSGTHRHSKEVARGDQGSCNRFGTSFQSTVWSSSHSSCSVDLSRALNIDPLSSSSCVHLYFDFSSLYVHLQFTASVGHSSQPASNSVSCPGTRLAEAGSDNRYRTTVVNASSVPPHSEVEKIPDRRHPSPSSAAAETAPALDTSFRSGTGGSTAGFSSTLARRLSCLPRPAGW